MNTNDPNYRLQYTKKAETLVSQLTLAEKVHLMGGAATVDQLLNELMNDPNRHYNDHPYAAGGIPEKGIPPMLFCDGPRGVVCGTGKSTCFPVSMMRGATFDDELEHRIGKAIGRECRAYGGNLFAGVCINLPYNPGWGRSQETYGEESYLLGKMGGALATGVQEQGVIACVKHYAFNSMEISRFKVNVICDKRTEREVYLQHFKDCVDAGAASIMSSYNLYEGTYCGHHDYLLNQVLKNEWDFDGFVMSDFIWGVKDTVEAANGGQDMEMCCTQYFGDKLVQAVKDGKVPEEKIDRAATRIIRTLLAFTATHEKESENESILACKEHVALALEAAEKGITLLQNKNRTLPLEEKRCEKIAVLGQLAAKENTGDHGSSRVFPPYVVTPLQGMIQTAKDVKFIHYSGEDLEHAKRLAKEADAVIFVVGYDHDDEGEYISERDTEDYTGSFGGDRCDSLGLHADEIHLINTVGPVNDNSVAVLIGGNMIMMSEWKDSVKAILMTYYSGMEGGTALGKVLFGHVNPSGKTPFVIPKKEDDLPQVKWDTKEQHYGYYHGYAKLDKEGIDPLIPFGFGLSYTSFCIDDARFSIKDDHIVGSCMVKNTGNQPGDEVIQLYIGFQNSSVDRPVKLLRGFKRVSLNPQENKCVTIKCPLEKLRWYNPASEKWELEKMKYEAFIGTSSMPENLLAGNFSIE